MADKEQEGRRQFLKRTVLFAAVFFAPGFMIYRGLATPADDVEDFEQFLGLDD